jgi:hypothetical protein
LDRRPPATMQRGRGDVPRAPPGGEVRRTQDRDGVTRLEAPQPEFVEQTFHGVGEYDAFVGFR